jgi:hypothetical protein
MWQEIVPWVDFGTVWDLLWPLSFTVVVIAARSRVHSRGLGPSRTPVRERLGMGPLVRPNDSLRPGWRGHRSWRRRDCQGSRSLRGRRGSGDRGTTVGRQAIELRRSTGFPPAQTRSTRRARGVFSAPIGVARPSGSTIDDIQGEGGGADPPPVEHALLAGMRRHILRRITTLDTLWRPF